ncbi:Aminopeptidase N [Halioglobus japonicus]|nr:Aminopeptidase N [Halioglobus japonicus]
MLDKQAAQYVLRLLSEQDHFTPFCYYVVKRVTTPSMEGEGEDKVNRLLKFAALSVILAAVSAVIWQQLREWQADKDTLEASFAPQGKLPEGVTPTHYNLLLRIDPDESHFSGSVEIGVDIRREVDAIWLHGKDIQIQAAVLAHSDGTVTDLSFREMGHSGIVQLSAASPIAAQQASISIHFAAAFSEKLDGLYIVEDQGRNYAFTQFEPVLARQVFPQFDEPRFKVPYDISLEVRTEHRAFGNTPIVKEETLQDGFKRLTLKTTHPMPSYLLAFAVGELDVLEYAAIPPNSIRDYPVPLRGIATRGKGQQIRYALKHIAELLTTLEEYFGTPYPYAKLDIVAVPDFAWGAMENVGLMTYRESILLLNDAPSASQQRRLMTVHAHELAHQWFGNLVTMPWWDDIWLNESFATWMASKAVHHWNPDMEVGREIVQRGHEVMETDIYADSRSIREAVENNDDIANVFDAINYSKGAAVLQMLESTVSPEVFRRGIQQYLQRHSWRNATAENLIQALAEAADNPQVADIANSYINQAGVPLLAVDWHCRDEALAVELRQQRYLPVGSTVNPDQLWKIPVCLTLINKAGPTHVCEVVEQRQQRFSYPVAQCPQAIMPNQNGYGYYRWTLAHAQWQTLLEHIGKLNAAEKLSVANNLAAEYQAARIDTSFYLQAIAPLLAEPEWDVSTEPAQQVQKIRDTIATREQQIELADYMYRHYKPLLDDLGLAPDTHFDIANPIATQLLRERVLNLVAVSLKQPDVLAVLAERGKALIVDGPNPGLHEDAIDRQLWAIAMASAVISEGAPYFEALTKAALDSDDANFRDDAFWALGQTVDPKLSRKILDLRWLYRLKLNEALTVLDSHIGKMENKERTLAWFKKYYPAIALAVPTPYIAGTPAVSGELCSREAYTDAQNFFGPKAASVEGMQRILLQNLEKIRLCYSLADAQRTDQWNLN